MRKTDDRGFAIVGSAIIVALAIFMGFGAAVIMQRSSMLHQAKLSQQRVARSSHESLEVTVNRKESSTVVTLTNDGSVPSVISAWIIRESDGALRAYGSLQQNLNLTVRDWDGNPEPYPDSLSEFEEGLDNDVISEGRINKIRFHDDSDNPLLVKEDHFSTEYTGYIKIPKNGTYGFATDSDDASVVLIDGEEVASWYGAHGSCGCTSHNGSVELDKGYHRVRYLQQEWGGGEVAVLHWNTPNHGWEVVPSSAYYHSEDLAISVNILGSSKIEISYSVSSEDTIGVYTRLGNIFWEGG